LEGGYSAELPELVEAYLLGLEGCYRALLRFFWSAQFIPPAGWEAE
jgi:hypothetical protein